MEQPYEYSFTLVAKKSGIRIPVYEKDTKDPECLRYDYFVRLSLWDNVVIYLTTDALPVDSSTHTREAILQEMSNLYLDTWEFMAQM